MTVVEGNSFNSSQRLYKLIAITSSILSRLSNMEDVNSIITHLGENEENFRAMKLIEEINLKFKYPYDRIVNLPKFVNVIMKQSSIEQNCLIYSLMLIDRLMIVINCSINSESSNIRFYLNSENVHMIFIISLYISMKILEDSVLSSKTFAKLVKVEHNKLIAMENEFLSILDYRVHIQDYEFDIYSVYFN